MVVGIRQRFPRIRIKQQRYKLSESACIWGMSDNDPVNEMEFKKWHPEQSAPLFQAARAPVSHPMNASFSVISNHGDLFSLGVIAKHQTKSRHSPASFDRWLGARTRPCSLTKKEDGSSVWDRQKTIGQNTPQRQLSANCTTNVHSTPCAQPAIQPI